MKLKPIFINGYKILVDENEKFNYPEKEIIYYDGEGNLRKACTGVIYNSSAKTILFADPELNLDLPVVPDWEQWEIEQLALNEVETQGWCRYDANSEQEEDLRNAIKTSLDYWTKHSNTEKEADDIVKSLLPSYIVVEEVEALPSNGNTHDWDKDINPKLIKLPDGTETGIIQEVIW